MLSIGGLELLEIRKQRFQTVAVNAILKRI